MKRLVTALALIGLVGVLTSPAVAQITNVNVRQITAIPQDSIDVLNTEAASLAALGGSDARDIIGRRILGNNEIAIGDTVRFTAVVMSNPKNSGNASVRDGQPGRLHIWVRDTSAASLGVEGMGIQIVDNTWQQTGSGALLIGDVVDIISPVKSFSETIQLDPVSVVPLGSLSDFNLPESLMDPVSVSINDINMNVGADGATQANYNNLASLRGQYIQITDATVLARNIASTRPQWSLTQDGGTTAIAIQGISLRYRNDRSDYPDDFNAQFDFVPPSPGSVVNLRGFLVFEDFTQVANYAPEALQIVPMESSDLEITVAAPQVLLDGLTAIPGADPFDVTATVTADPTRTLTSVTVSYYSSASADTVVVAATNSEGDTWTAPIPSPGDTEFVTYWFTAEDNLATSNRSADVTYKVLEAGITTIEDIQKTQDEGEGGSPFAGLTAAMNLTAVVMTDPGTSGLYSIQSDPGLAPWSGIQLRNVSGLNRGDIINITEATVLESNGLTRLDNVVFTVTGTGAAYDYKVVTTDALLDPAIAEAHEGMMLRIDNVVVTSNNADGPTSDFGEFLISSSTPENAVRVDDASSALSGSGLNLTFDTDDTISFVRGHWTYSFSNFKLLPEDGGDLGDVNVAIDELGVDAGFALSQNYPNPFASQTEIAYSIESSSNVSLIVYDVLGREVRALVNAVMPAGTHTATFTTDGLGSGLYLYRLKAGNDVSTRSMLISR